MYRQALHNQEANTLSTLPKQPCRHKGRHPDERPACQSSVQPVRRAGRQAAIMFWAVIADCSPLLPVSGLAIVAEAEWMGSEPEMTPTTCSASNKGLECIHHRQNKYLQQKWSHVWAGTQPNRLNKTTVNTAKCVSLHAHMRRQTSGKTQRKTGYMVSLFSHCQSLPLHESGRRRGWTLALSEGSAITGLAGRERAWRPASLTPRTVIIETHYTVKMEPLEPNYCRLNYSKSTLWPQRISMICSPSHHSELGNARNTCSWPFHPSFPFPFFHVLYWWYNTCVGLWVGSVIPHTHTHTQNQQKSTLDVI